MSEVELQRQHSPLTKDSVEHMIELAERLRASNGGLLDDAAVQAISEATGAPSEYVRLAIKVRAEKERKSVLEGVRAQFYTLEPDVRRHVLTSVMATLCGFFLVLNAVTPAGQYGLFSMVAIIFLFAGIYQIGTAREKRTAAISGALLGGVFFIAFATVAAILSTGWTIHAWLLIPIVVAAISASVSLHNLVSQNRAKLGLRDPIEERQELLRQLVSLQDKLKASEQKITFLSLDIVGSTRLKELADPLAVEFTFNEYYKFVEHMVGRFSGTVHSTAGDGVTCAFESPLFAFQAAKAVQTGIIELNTYRNRLGEPLVLRAGIHTGSVMTPDSSDITSINFAHVIDVSAHIQKAAPPGGIAVSDASAAGIPGGPSSIGTQRLEVSNIWATLWVPKAIQVHSGGSHPPSSAGLAVSGEPPNLPSV